MNTQNALINIDIMSTIVLIMFYIGSFQAEYSKEGRLLPLLAVIVSLFAIPLEGVPHHIIVVGYILIIALAFACPNGLRFNQETSIKIAFGLGIFITGVTGLIMSVDRDQHLWIFDVGLIAAVVLIYPSLKAKRKA